MNHINLVFLKGKQFARQRFKKETTRRHTRRASTRKKGKGGKVDRTEAC
jgi:hypothetical protein